MQALLVVLLMLALTSDSLAKKVEEQEVDYLALASMLVQDGHMQRASQALDQVDMTDESLDKKLFFVLRGLVALDQQLYEAAVTGFEQAIRAGNTDPLVYLNLGRAHFGNKNYAGTVRALLQAGQATHEEPLAVYVLAQAYWELGKVEDSLLALRRADARFPKRIEFARLEIFYLIKLNLYQQVTARRDRMLARSEVQPQDLLAMSQALREAHRIADAKATLEVARLRFPDDVGLTVMLSRVYMDSGEFLSSALTLEHAARRDEAYLIETAEMYRRAGRLTRALLINKRISDQKTKMRQRLQILLELERFEMIAGMESRLSRLGLLEEEQIRYALAYGYFQIRDFDSAEKHIRELSEASFFEKGLVLRKAIAACEQAGWSCQ